MTIPTIEEIKAALISKGCTVLPDMNAPVEIYEGREIIAKSRSIDGLTIGDIVELISRNGDHIIFYGPVSTVDTTWVDSGKITGHYSGAKIRYEAFRKDEQND